MEVKAISNSQPAFNGYLGKNIQKYVNNVVTKEVNIAVNIANFNTKKVDVNDIKSIKSLGDQVLDKLSKYVGKMHEKTILDLNDMDSSIIRFSFKNKIVPHKKVKIFSSSTYKNPAFFSDDIALPKYNNISRIDDARKDDLHTLDIIANQLYKIDSKEIDNIFYKSAVSKLKDDSKYATGFWSKFMLRKFAKKIDEFAADLGIDSSAQVRAEEYIRSTKEREILDQKAIEKMEEYSKLNKKIADEILKG